ncbi:MAG TPA: serine/threonine-protein kinase [Polyangiaceae bacterium]
MPLATPLPPRPETLALGPGRELVLGELIGRGSSSTVYRATLVADFRLRRPVAVKIFDPLPTDEREQVIEGLARATRHAANVRHPNVAAPEDFGLAASNQPMIVTELVDGVALDRFLDSHSNEGERIPTDLALFIALEIAEGLAGVRDAFTADGVRLNMGHHGLAAREVLLSRHGEVKVTDFGISLAMRPSSGVLRLRAFARRMATLPPEVARGARGDARSDVFALGIIMREMLVGPRFQHGTSDGEVLDMIAHGAIHTPPMTRALPDPLAGIVRRAIEIDPHRRYPHAGLLANDLRRAIALMGVGDERVFLRRAIENRFGQQSFEGGLEDGLEEDSDGDLDDSGARRARPRDYDD